MTRSRAMLGSAVVLAVLTLGIFIAWRSTPAPLVITLTQLGSTSVNGKSLVLFSVRKTNAFHAGCGMAIFPPPSAGAPINFYATNAGWWPKSLGFTVAAGNTA